MNLFLKDGSNSRLMRFRLSSDFADELPISSVSANCLIELHFMPLSAI